MLPHPATPRGQIFTAAVDGGSFYRVRQGSVELFVLDTDHARQSAVSMDRQRDWVRAAVASSPAPWRFVVAHHPPYSSTKADDGFPELRWLVGSPASPGTATGASADPDGDGLANGLEFAFGSDPTAPTPPPALAPDPGDPGAVRLGFSRRADHAQIGLGFQVEASPDLVRWAPAGDAGGLEGLFGPGFLIEVADTGGGGQEARVPVTFGPVFLRVRVTGF